MDTVEAVRLYRMAADQDHNAAQFNLGVCYRNGIGVLEDEVEARRWFQLAANGGNTDAISELSKSF